MFQLSESFGFLAQNTAVTYWLTPVWLLSMGIGIGFVLSMLMVLKLSVLQKIPAFNSISQSPGTWRIFGGLLGLFYFGLYLVFYYWRYGFGDVLNDGDATSDLVLGCAFALPICLLIGFGAWKLVSKKMAGEVWRLATEGFLGWLNRIGVAFLCFAILGFVLAAFNGFGVVKFVDDPGEMMASLARLPYAGTQRISAVIEPSDVNHQGDALPLSFNGAELVDIRVKTDQKIEISTEPITAEAAAQGLVYELRSANERHKISKPASRLTEKTYDTFYVSNFSAAQPANVTIEVNTAPVISEVILIPTTAICVVMTYLLYLIFCALLPKVAAISLSTFKTEISQPLYLLVLGTGIVFVIGSIFIPYNTFGEDIKLYKDSGLTLIRVLAIFTAIWAASKSVAEEIEGRTALTVLSKPVGRRQFILGKFSGISLAIALLFVVLGLWFIVWTAYKPVYDGRENVQRVQEWSVCYVQAISMFPALALCFLEVIIFVAISVAISTRMGILPNFLICFAIYILGHLTPLLVQSDLADQFAPVVTFGNLIAVIFPVLDHFDAQAAINSNRVVPIQYLGWAVIYMLLYGTISMLVALVFFEDRDLA